MQRDVLGAASRALCKSVGGSDALLAVRLILPATRCEGDDATPKTMGRGEEGVATEETDR